MRLCIISLKKFCFKDGAYWTYGGFGEYVNSLLPYFDEIHLCVPVTKKSISGMYPMNNPKLTVTELPYYRNELELLLKLPVIAWKMGKGIKLSDITNPRIPDMTGVFGWIWSTLYQKPHFVSVVSDVHAFLDAPNNTKTKGIIKWGLYSWFRLFLIFQRIIFHRSLCFPQGSLLASRYPKALSSFEWVSTSIHENDIVKETYDKCQKEELHLLHVGRVTRAKGHVYLLRMLPILKKMLPGKKVVLDVVGKDEGPISDALHIEMRNLHLNETDVIWHGNVEHGTNLWSFFDSADIFVFPSIWEGTPKVLLEAMARGLPIVSSDVGGIPTLVSNEVTGLLVESQNPKALAEAVKRFVDDKKLRNNCIQTALEVAKKHTLSSQTKFIIEKLNCHYSHINIPTSLSRVHE
jgi:glycosyltransferase involved in cell wall biosynthesis